MVFSFTMSVKYVRGIQKIAVFGMKCTDYSYTIVEDSWTGGTTTFDLLLDTAKTIALPTLTITPSSCYTTIWEMYRNSDQADMLAT